jgi:mono/diheme cytochrome c family protein
MLLIGTLIVQVARAAEMPEVCIGCHSEARSQPSGRFPTGFGRWTDAQCFGCHQEFNEIGELFAQGVKDKRYYSLPIRDERLKALARNPLPYGHAPLQIAWDKYDPERLLRFLRRPTGYPSRMPAFPDIRSEDFAFLRTTPVPSGDAQRGEAIFQRTCVSCHAKRNPVSGHSTLQLSVYSSAWIYQYASGRAQTKERSMPVLNVSEAEAADIFAYLGQLRKKTEEQLDQAVARIQAPAAKGGAVPRAVAGYIENRFFRDGGCVHCHGIEGRALARFDTSAAGIRSWLKVNDPLELWRRLEIRGLEEEAGLGAEKPGMPMTGPALPKPMRDLLLTWIQGGCPLSNEERLCVGAAISKTKGVKK